MGLFKTFYLLSIFIIFGNITMAKGAEVRFYNSSFDDYSIYSLDNLPSILNSSAYNPNLKTVCYIFGFTSFPEADDVRSVVEAYHERANICVLDWEEEASTGILGLIAYPVTAIPNAMKVGNEFGEGLVELNNAGLNLSNVHVIGFSLGGQLAGYAGRKVQEYGLILGRITGFDPAGPAYDYIDLQILIQLSSSDATFVDIIHTNPGNLGSNEATGTVDIWANCGSNIQPGCNEGTILEVLLSQNICSHNRCWEYFTEALEYPSAFEARAASDCDAWMEGNGTNHTIFIGDNIDTNARGNFYLWTNSEPLFGLGEEGSHPAS